MVLHTTPPAWMHMAVRMLPPPPPLRLTLDLAAYIRLWCQLLTKAAICPRCFMSHTWRQAFDRLSNHGFTMCWASFRYDAVDINTFCCCQFSLWIKGDKFECLTVLGEGWVGGVLCLFAHVFNRGLDRVLVQSSALEAMVMCRCWRGFWQCVHQV
jgi:hypothetical protein